MPDTILHRVAVIGIGSMGPGSIVLGSMGPGMETSLRRAGHAVSGDDLAEKATAALAAAGGRAACSQADAAAGADIAVAVVVNSAQTEGALFGASGILTAMLAGSVVMGRDDDASPARLIARTTGIELPATKEH